MSPSRITMYSRDALKTCPRLRVPGYQEPLRKDSAASRDAFQQSTSSEPIVVAPETMILQYHCKGWWVTRVLTEQGIVGRDPIRTEENNGEAARAVAVVEFAVPLKNFEKCERRVRCGGSAVSLRRQLRGPGVGNPFSGDEVARAELNSSDTVIPAEALDRVSEF